jgi:phage N-6-adenine-methyltransferase
MDKVMFSHNSDEWYTPQDFFDRLNEIYHFDLDACATDFNTKCKNYYTILDNSLNQEWNYKSVWCNPPYSNIKDFMKKAYEENKKYNNNIVLLVPSRTDTKWFHEYCYNKDNVKIEFIKGRLKFGGSKNSAPFPSMLVIFEED